MKQIRTTATLASALIAGAVATVPAHAVSPVIPDCATTTQGGTSSAPVLAAQVGPGGLANIEVSPASATAAYRFDFGDMVATTGTTAAVQHQYPSQGSWAITATITDSHSPAGTALTCSIRTLPVASSEHRYSGNTRYDTGAAISQSLWATTENSGYLPDPVRRQAQAVVLASGDQFPDALAGVPLAAYKQGPLLLTPQGSLINTTEWEIRRVLPKGKTIYVLGGPKALNPSIDERLRADGYQVTRLAGDTRYQTALKIATDGLGNPADVIAVTGHDFPDALAAGPVATSNTETVAGKPAAILLTDGDTVNDAGTAAYLTARFNHDPSAPFPHQVLAVGGAAARALGALPGANPTPPFLVTCGGNDFKFGILAGANRYATAACLAGSGQRTENPGGATNDTAAFSFGFANGTTFADALTGGAALATTGGSILLTDSDTIAPETLQAMQLRLPIGNNGDTRVIDVFGGPKAISPTIESRIRAIAGF